MIIDAHLHVFKYREHWSEWAAKTWIEHNPGIYWLTGKEFKPSDYDGPYEMAIEWMDKSNVDKAFLLGNWQTPNGIKVPVEYTVEAKEKHPDRFYAFCTPDPLGGQKSVDQIDWTIREKGFVGAGELLPTYNHIHPTDKRLFPLYAKVADLNGCILIHTGYGPTVKNRMEWQHPHQFEDLLIEFPETRILFGHCGFHYYQDVMLMMTRSHNLFADFAWWHVLPFDYIARALVFAKQLGVLERIFFGTDFPHVSLTDMVELYKGIPAYTEKHELDPAITDEDMAGFFGENARRCIEDWPH